MLRVLDTIDSYRSVCECVCVVVWVCVCMYVSECAGIWVFCSVCLDVFIYVRCSVYMYEHKLWVCVREKEKESTHCPCVCMNVLYIHESKSFFLFSSFLIFSSLPSIITSYSTLDTPLHFSLSSLPFHFLPFPPYHLLLSPLITFHSVLFFLLIYTLLFLFSLVDWFQFWRSPWLEDWRITFTRNTSRK